MRKKALLEIKDPKDIEKIFNRKRKTNLKKAIELAAQGLSFQEIAQILNTSKSTIFGLFKRLGISKQYLKDLNDHMEYRDIKTIMLEMELHKRARDEVQKGEARDVRDAIIGYGTVFDKVQITTGGATQNISLINLTKQLERPKMSQDNGTNDDD